jgi:hypothetical protein
MANKRRSHDEEAWTNVKKICRLTARQVEMARRLGMNPKKLPRLRPSPHQRWKLPVGAFIEECYRKRFGGDPRDQDPRGVETRSRKPWTTDLGAEVPEPVADPAWQLSDLACHLVNLADDLQRWLVHGSFDPELLPEIREELQAIATALETGDPISPVPAIPLPPQQRRRGLSRQGGQERAFDDEDIPF